MHCHQPILRRFVAIVLLATCSVCFIGTASAFTTTAFGVTTSFSRLVAQTRRTCVASTPLYVSDEQETPAVVEEDKESEALASSTEVLAEEAAPTDEEASSNKRKVQRERHTLFVGNLPFGKLELLCCCIIIRCWNATVNEIPLALTLTSSDTTTTWPL